MKDVDSNRLVRLRLSILCASWVTTGFFVVTQRPESEYSARKVIQVRFGCLILEGAYKKVVIAIPLFLSGGVSTSAGEPRCEN